MKFLQKGKCELLLSKTQNLNFIKFRNFIKINNPHYEEVPENIHDCYSCTFSSYCRHPLYI
jgi:hypothetical protein